jgi:hypothetical protein
MFEIVMNKAKTQATIHLEDGRSFNLYHSEGLVADLIAEMLYGAESFESYIRSFEDTVEIDLTKYNKVG